VLSLTDITNNSTQDACITTLTDSRTIAVDPTTVAGVIGNDTIVCKGGSGLLFEKTAGVGSIVKWQSRVKGNTTWTDINNNANTIYFFNLNDTTEYRAIYKSGLCNEEGSNVITATPRPLPLATIDVQAATDTICSGQKATLTLTIFNVIAGQDYSVIYTEGSVQKTYNSSSAGYTSGPGTKNLTTGALSTTSDITLQSITTTTGVICSNTLTNVAKATITVIDLPFATITSGPDSICQGSSITFTVNVSNVKAGNTWRLIYDLESDADTITGTGPGNFTHTDNDPNTATSAIITLKEILNTGTPHGCLSSNTDDWSIYIFKPTVAGKIEANDTICKGGNTSVKEVTGTIKEGNIIRWESRTASSSSFTAISNSSLKLDIINLQETSYYRAIYKSGRCDTAISNVIEIVVRELPLATIAGSATVCSGDSTTLNITVSNVGSTQTWVITYLEGTVTKTTTGVGAGSFNLKVGNFLTNTDITMQKIVTVSGTPQCINDKLTNNAKATVVVNQRPFASIDTVSTRICQNSKGLITASVSNVRSNDSWTLTYNVGTSTGLTYSNVGPGTFNITTPTLSNPGYVNVKLTFIKNNTTTCDSTLNTQFDSIFVDATTDPGFIIGDTTVCNGSNSGVVTQTSGNGSIIRWEYSQDNGSTWTTISNTASTYTYSNLTKTTLFRSIRRNGTCSEATQSTPVKITIRELPVATISGSQTICSGQTAALTVSASNTYSEGWNVVYLEGTMIDTLKVSGPLTSQTLVTKVLTTTTDITLKKIYLTSGTPQCANDNLTNNATATVNVNQLPVATIVSGPDSVCTGNTATVKISVNNVRTGETWKVYWSINGGNADSATGIGAGSFNITSAALTANPSTIKLTRIDNTTTGCFSTLNSTKTIQVDPTTVGGTLSANATVCKGSNSGTLVLGSDARGVVVRWEYSEDNGATWSNISNIASTHNYSSLTKTTKYRVLVRSGACASAYSSEVVITVNELPVATVSGSKAICEGSRSFVLITVSNVSSTQTWEITYLEGSTTKTKTGTGAVTNDTLFTSVLNQTTDITLQSIKITSGAPLCSNSSLVNNATATITVIDNPLVTISSYPKNVCKGDNPAITIVISKVKSTESWTLLYRVNSGANTSTTGVGSGTFSFNIGILNNEGPNGVRFVSLTNTGSNPNCTSPLTDSITINVDSTSLGGSLTGPAKVCKGGNGTLSLSGFRGTVQKWQYSTDGSNYFDIANTASSYSFTNLTVKTWFRVIVKNGACPEAFSNAFIVDIQDLPTVTIANPTQTICSGSSTTLNLTIGNLLSTDTWTVTYKENGTNKTVSGTGNSLAWNVGPFTTTTIIELTGITQTNGLGCTNTATAKATITVLDNPKATISSYPDSLCVGSLVNFKVNVSNVRTTDAWSLDFDINGVSGNKKGTGPGSFTINTGIGATVGTTTIKLTNIAITATPFCTTVLTETATIIVTPLSVGGTLSPSTAVGCAGTASGTLTLSVNIGAVQYWEYSTDGGNTWSVTGNKNNTLTYTNLTMTTMYRVYVKSGPCSGAYSATSTVTIIPLPTAIVVGSPRVCPGVGARFDITVSNVGATDNWTVRYTVNGGAVQNVTGTGTGTKSITTAGFTYPNTITVKIVNVENTTYGCVNSAVVSQAEGKVTPNPVPAFTANNACADTIVVFNNNSTIAEGTIGGFKWYFGDGDSSLAVSPTHSYKVAGTYNVRLVAMSDNSCTAEITKSVTVFANPVARFTTANACLNVDAQFTDASTVSTGTITGWNWDFGDGATANTQNAAHRYSGAGTYLVTLTVTTNNGCNAMITKSITIYTLPEANFVAQPVCQNSAMKFINASAIGAGDMTYNWDFAGQGTSTQKDPSFTFTGFGSFNVKLLATSNFGCKDSIIRDVTVNPNPVASFTADPRCIGEESNFVNTSSVATGAIVEYYWNFGDTTFSGLQNPAHKYARPGSYSASLRVKSDKGCESTFTGTADVLALPDVQLTANGPISFCFGDSVTLSANPNARTYNWSWSTGTSTNGSVVAKSTGWYKVRITAPPIGCANEDSIFVNVWALPTVNAWPADKITQDRDTINRGESIQLHASGGVNYSWNPTTYLSNGGNGADPVAERMDATTRYIVTVTDINGCVNSDTLTIVVLDNFKLVVYNVVTPNGDGYNDRWYIDNIWAYPTANVVILNRYGMEVFNKTGYDNANGWNGTNSSNGKDLPDGAYFYIITSPDFPTVYTGSINLIRTN
jgi:gliding motility-associated-like protein